MCIDLQGVVLLNCWAHLKLQHLEQVQVQVQVHDQEKDKGKGREK